LYDLQYAKPAEQYLKKINDKNLLDAFKKALDEIKKNPYIGKQKTGDLRGLYGFDVYHSGINYELAYRIVEKNGKTVIIILAGTRENFYKELKRLI